MSIHSSRLGQVACRGRSHGTEAGVAAGRAAIEYGRVLLVVAAWLSLYGIGLLALSAGAAYLTYLAVAYRRELVLLICVLLVPVMVMVWDGLARRRPSS
jgi:hypothetical protein